MPWDEYFIDFTYNLIYIFSQNGHSVEEIHEFNGYDISEIEAAIAEKEEEQEEV